MDLLNSGFLLDFLSPAAAANINANQPFEAIHTHVTSYKWLSAFTWLKASSISEWLEEYFCPNARFVDLFKISRYPDDFFYFTDSGFLEVEYPCVFNVLIDEHDM